MGRAQAPGGASNEALFARFDHGDFRVVLDAQSPLPFTEEGVKAAYRLLGSRRAKGKIVIEISQPADRNASYLNIRNCPYFRLACAPVTSCSGLTGRRHF